MLINAVLKALLRFSSKFEKHHHRTDEIYSSTMKMFVVQFINTAVIIMLVNWKWDINGILPDNFPILSGQYT